MREISYVVIAGLLGACSGKSIDAGTNDVNPSDAGVGDVSTSDAGAAVAIPQGDDSGTFNEDEAGPDPLTLVSGLQFTASVLVSDGTTVYWSSTVDGVGGPIAGVPVQGGWPNRSQVQTLVPGHVPSAFLAVDDTDVFYLQSGAIYRVPKAGGSPVVFNEGADAGVSVGGAVALGGTAYWIQSTSVESDGSIVGVDPTIKSAPLQTGAATTVWDVQPSGAGGPLAVTSSTGFFADFFGGLSSFSLADVGAPEVQVPGSSQIVCQATLSDTDAIYCQTSASILRVASDGAITTLGDTISPSPAGLQASTAPMAVDDTSVYWVVPVQAGTIMRAPKTGGAAVVVGYDANPIAVAVDAHYIFWSDQAGNIMRAIK